MSYFQKVVITRKLFSPLGQSTYRNFLITDKNLAKMMEQNNVDNYLGFFRKYYIQRKTGQSKGAEAPTPKQGTKTVQQPSEQKTAVEPEKYSSPYNENIQGEHYFTFVILRLGIDQPAFISGINQFNLANYENLNLKVEVKPLDDTRQIVLISGLPDNKTAIPYFKKVVRNRVLYNPLRKTNYRNFLISKNNFEIFLKEKNILDYMDFYKRVYLGK
jgi:hypothetical protein